MNNILTSVCENHNITLNELLSPRRNRKFVLARKECARILRENGLSYPKIGKIMNRDHSSIVHLIKPTPSHKPKRGYVETMPSVLLKLNCKEQTVSK